MIPVPDPTLGRDNLRCTAEIQQQGEPVSQAKWLQGSTTTAHASSCSPRKAVLEQQGRTHSQHLDVQSRDVTLQVLLGLHLLVQLVLQAVPLVLQLPQLGGHIELLPGFFLKQLLRKDARKSQGPTPGSSCPGVPLEDAAEYPPGCPEAGTQGTPRP